MRKGAAAALVEEINRLKCAGNSSAVLKSHSNGWGSRHTKCQSGLLRYPLFPTPPPPPPLSPPTPLIRNRAVFGGIGRRQRNRFQIVFPPILRLLLRLVNCRLLGTAAATAVIGDLPTMGPRRGAINKMRRRDARKMVIRKQESRLDGRSFQGTGDEEPHIMR